MELRGVGPRDGRGAVTSIALVCADDERGVAGFAGATPEGISLESSLDDIRAAYGEPSLVDRRMAEYADRGLEFWFTGPDRRELERIYVWRPLTGGR